MPTCGLIINDAGSTASHPYSLQIDGLDVAKQPGTPGSLFGVDIDSVTIKEAFGEPATMDFLIDDPLRTLALTRGQNVYAVDHRGVLLSTGVWRSDDMFRGVIQSVSRIPDTALMPRWQVRAIGLDSLLDGRYLTSGVLPAGMKLDAAMQSLMGSFDPRVSALNTEPGAQGGYPTAVPNLIGSSANLLSVAVPLAGKTYREAISAINDASDIYVGLEGVSITNPQAIIGDIDAQGRFRYLIDEIDVPFGGTSPGTFYIREGSTSRTVVPYDIEVNTDLSRLITAVYVHGVDAASSRWVLNNALIATYGRIEAYIEAPECTTSAMAGTIGSAYLAEHQTTTQIALSLSGTHDQLHPQGPGAPERGGWHARTRAYLDSATGYWSPDPTNGSLFVIWELEKRFSGGGAWMEIRLSAGSRSGSGASALRSSAAVTLDTTRAAGRLVGTLSEVAVRSKAGAPTDADFDVPRDGFIVIDTTNSRIYVRSAGTWKSVLIA